MGRGEYGYSSYGYSFVGNGAVKPSQPAQPAPQAPPPPTPQTPPQPPQPDVWTDGRGQYGQPSRTEHRPWTDDQRKALQRAYGLSAIGSVAGAVLWKEHRIWGFILGGMAGGGVGNLIFAPRNAWCDFFETRQSSRMSTSTSFNTGPRSPSLQST